MTPFREMFRFRWPANEGIQWHCRDLKVGIKSDREGRGLYGRSYDALGLHSLEGRPILLRHLMWLSALMMMDVISFSNSTATVRWNPGPSCLDLKEGWCCWSTFYLSRGTDTWNTFTEDISILVGLSYPQGKSWTKYGQQTCIWRSYPNREPCSKDWATWPSNSCSCADNISLWSLARVKMADGCLNVDNIIGRLLEGAFL